MSAAPQAPRRIAELCDEAVHELNQARRGIYDLQRELAPGDTLPTGTTVTDVARLWARLDKIDDHIHNALAKLGD